MSADAPSNEMIALLLRVLEHVENAADDLPVSTLQKPAEMQVDAEPNSLSTTANGGVNLFVERVAAAMSKVRDPSPARTIG